MEYTATIKLIICPARGNITSLQLPNLCKYELTD
jgi:hypothetical protein